MAFGTPQSRMSGIMRRLSRRGDEAGIPIANPGPSTSLLPGQPPTPGAAPTPTSAPEMTAEMPQAEMREYGTQGAPADEAPQDARASVSTSRLPGNRGNGIVGVRPGGMTRTAEPEFGRKPNGRR